MHTHTVSCNMSYSPLTPCHWTTPGCQNCDWNIHYGWSPTKKNQIRIKADKAGRYSQCLWYFCNTPANDRNNFNTFSDIKLQCQNVWLTTISPSSYVHTKKEHRRVCLCITLAPPLVLPWLPPVFPLTAPMKRASKSSCRLGSRECSSSIPAPHTQTHFNLNTYHTRLQQGCGHDDVITQESYAITLYTTAESWKYLLTLLL